MDQKIKDLANNILEQCYSQGLTLKEMNQLKIVLTARIGDILQRAQDEAFAQEMRLDLLEF